MEFEQRPKSKAMHITSVKISPEFYKLAKKHHIMFSHAMRVGLSLMFAEKGESAYDNKLNISRKIDLLRQLLEQKSQELEELKAKMGGLQE